jgi:hypothetical protein
MRLKNRGSSSELIQSCSSEFLLVPSLVYACSSQRDLVGCGLTIDSALVSSS